MVENPGSKFVVTPGGSISLSVESQGCNFGLFSREGMVRTVVVELLSDSRVTYGPVKIDVPSNDYLIPGR